MKVLIDENLPKRLKQDFQDYQIFTVREQGWQGKQNGELLKLMLQEQFTVLLTFDKNIQHQQNLKNYPLNILILNAVDNRYLSLKPLVEKILKILKSNFNYGVTLIS